MQKRSNADRGKLRSGKHRVVLGKRERQRLIQLGLCLTLFLVVFLGKGKMPADILRYIQTDTDFSGAFSALGSAISQGEPVTKALGELAVEVFGVRKPESAAAAPTLPEYLPADLGAVTAEQMLNRLPTRDSMLLMLGKDTAGVPVTAEPAADAGDAADSEPASRIPEYSGPTLPEGATMEYYDLGLPDPVTPVMGEITSVFGYRDHPVSGEYLFHSGADIAAEVGTPVAAFSGGVVEFIGESEAYGLYIQLDHGNGIKTFYCHCSELYARKGERVEAGQTIAAVGDTGNATGPHLHIELKRNGVLLNPLYYIESVEAEP